MSLAIFTYGSLMFDPVWRRVVRGRYASAAAVLADHARYAVRDETYPGVVPQAGASVAGLLYFDVSADDVAALDAFEGNAYRRDQVTVTTADGKTYSAATYLFLNGADLTGDPWLPEAFRMERFLATYCRERLSE
ncbi:Uncharacterized conserved protein YtfP, gamma-glutamylcyclotransferase (GGCT)/AIG2-like family [Noviherbaspirillum humi]|uniref:Putative gamma-glutamylcyclotransferase n=1 Tax=Noviherbaspirillum humi TaxID=1688639 RepID=A0A239BUA7_9BURK|nr:gamma-glutamylcyclotransferase family protein [Noviherbaspirillum humi]SNS11625.1 Uncharacterized conserved protein YtfP, gamma-glutamylcyclotransferase (GGCT)/AIG2-like family [Noviherbaspirillum humi]